MTAQRHKEAYLRENGPVMWTLTIDDGLCFWKAVTIKCVDTGTDQSRSGSFLQVTQRSPPRHLVRPIVVRCHPQGCVLTGSLIPGHLLTRDSESFGPISRGPGLTFKVQLGPRVVSLELETFSPAANLSQVVAGKAINAKTPRAETLGVWCKLREPSGS